MPDVFANIAERTETTSSMYADINQLMENLRAIIGNGESAPSKTMEQLAVEQLKETGSNYTILDDDGYTVFIIDTSGGDVDLTFPTRADNIGRRILVINDGPNCVNCKPEGSDDINGYNADVVINVDKGWWNFTADSTGWKGITDGNSTILEFSSSSNVAISSPQTNQWYNPSNHSLALTTGIWMLEYQIVVRGAADNTKAYIILKSTLSTANNSESDVDFSTESDFRITSGYVIDSRTTFYKGKLVTVASNTTYYLNIYITNSGTTALEARGDFGTTFIRARRIG